MCGGVGGGGLICFPPTKTVDQCYVVHSSIQCVVRSLWTCSSAGVGFAGTLFWVVVHFEEFILNNIYLHISFI